MHDCFTDSKAVSITGKALLLFGLKVVTNVKLLLSLLPFETLKFSMGIFVDFRIASWIKFVDILRNVNLFKVCPIVFFQTWLSSNTMQIRLASVKVILFLHCLGWQQLNGTHLRVSVFDKTCPSKCYWSQDLSLSWYREMVNRGCAVHRKFDIVINVIKYIKMF